MARNTARMARLGISWTAGVARIRWLAAIICLVPAHGQYGFDSWTTDQGLPQNSIHAIVQTRDSYLWLTTSDGLVRFDGVRFAVFNKSNSPGITNNRFTALYEDAAGTLWIGTEGAALTQYQHGKFTTYKVPGDVASNHWVKGISGDSSGHLHVLCGDRVIEWVNGRFVPAHTGNFPENQWVQFDIVSRGHGGGFWSPTRTALSLFVEGKAYSWTHREGLPSLSFQAVGEDEHGTVWVASGAGLIKIANGKRPRLSSPDTSLPGRMQTFVSSPQLKLVCKDGREGMLIVNLGSGERQRVHHLPPGLWSDLDRAVFYEDREENLWIGTYARGLYRVRKQSITTYSEEQGLRDHNIYPIYQDRRGAIWLGAWPGTLSRWMSGKITNYGKRDGLSGEEITALYEDRSGRLWVGAYGENNGLRVLQDNRFVVPNGLRGLGTVSAIFEDRKGAFWLGTEERLVRFSQGVLTSYTAKDGLAGNDVRVISENAKGELWFGGSGGLTQLHAGKFVAYSERNGLPSDSVRSLYVDPEDVLWIGTYDGGLARFKNGKFTTYTIHEGLFSNGVFQILEDSRGNLWMSSNQGIYRVPKQELNEFAAGKRNAISSIAYGKSDGMLNIECNGNRSPAGIKASDGKLWFPTQDGAAVIDPATVGTNPQPPPVVIESVMIDRRPMATDREVEVKRGPDNFEIQYTALSFINSDRIKFKYKLAGLDADWINAGTRRTAYYSHVPPGKYVFQVIATNSDGIWNVEGRSLAVRVLPPFYRTWWFGLLLLLSTAGLICLVWRYRVAQLMRAHAAQQAFTRQLISSQESERKRIAAELHDSLGQHLVVIKNLALMALNNGTALRKIEEISSEASHALAEVREISYNLRPYQLDRIGLTKAIEAIVDKAARATTIQFRTNVDNVDNVFARESEINFYRIVQECINNVVKHSEATAVDVTVSRTAAGLLLTICDDGKGFIRGATDSYSSGGFGLVGIRERAQLLGGKPTIQSSPGHGTTIIVEIPSCDMRNGN